MALVTGVRAANKNDFTSGGTFYQPGQRTFCLMHGNNIL